MSVSGDRWYYIWDWEAQKFIEIRCFSEKCPRCGYEYVAGRESRHY